MADSKKQSEQEQKPAQASGGVGRWIVIGAAILVVMGGSIGASLYFMGPRGEAPEHAAATAEHAPKVALYLPLKPAFIVNFMAGTKPRYLQVELAVLSRDEVVIEAVKTHMPVVRSAIIDLFGHQQYEALQTDDGKQMLREQIRALIDGVLMKESRVQGVEAVLVTGFVMQ